MYICLHPISKTLPSRHRLQSSFGHQAGRGSGHPRCAAGGTWHPQLLEALDAGPGNGSLVMLVTIC